jgi:hypothetical protein
VDLGAAGFVLPFVLLMIIGRALVLVTAAGMTWWRRIERVPVSSTVPAAAETIRGGGTLPSVPEL